MNVAAPLRRSLQQLKTFHKPTWICASCQRRRMTSDGRFEAGDTALLRRTDKHDDDGYLIWPLQTSKEIHRNDGLLKHDDIIGKRVRDVVATHKGRKYRIHETTMDEYVRLTPRTCTPIYAADANLIVTLLDIHTKQLDGTSEPESEVVQRDQFRILEAGTGHGSLTLHLARSVHPANSSPSGRRGAVIHTVDNNSKRSKHARKIVQGFKNGIYANGVEFHVTDIGAVLDRAVNGELEAEPPGAGATKFNHIILDLPGSHTHMPLAARVLKVDGCLLLWVPSITQILEAMKAVRSEGLPLWLDRVVEVGQGISGGRLWDVRATRIRNFDRKVGGFQKTDEEEPDVAIAVVDVDSTEESNDGSETGAQNAPIPPSSAGQDQGEAIVCRPKVGERTFGGGFIGLWRRTREAEE